MLTDLKEACEVLMFYRIRIMFRTRLISLYDMLGHKSAFISVSQILIQQQLLSGIDLSRQMGS